MCGILFYIAVNKIKKNESMDEDDEESGEDDESEDVLIANLTKASLMMQHRGPDEFRQPTRISNNVIFSFNRLKINGLDTASGQPMIKDNCSLICNGEIYNFKQLQELHKLNMVSHSDCECIIDLYKKFGFKAMLQMLEGVFSIALYDNDQHILYIARDPVGIRPLFFGRLQDNTGYLFASEAKALYAYNRVNTSSIMQYPAGSYTVLTEYTGDYKYRIKFNKYISLYTQDYSNLSYDECMIAMNALIKNAVHKRCINTDRPIGALLSGGIDSSIIAMLAMRHVPDLRTFAIGLKDSKDLHYARIAAEAIGSKHTEVVYTIAEGQAAINEIVRILETPDITTIRASIPMYLLSKYIKEHTDITIVLSGEGPDEVLAGYLYNHSAPSSTALNIDGTMRVMQLPYYDVLRSDRCTAANSLEVRVPFLCKNIIQLAFGMNTNFLNPVHTGIEKKLLRDIYANISSSPEQQAKWKIIINRPKEAFSDGVGHEWKQSLTELAASIISDEMYEKRKWKFPYLIPTSKEAYLYRIYYEEFYSRASGKPLVNHYWMPSWSNHAEHGGDPSATLLSIYKART